MDTEYLKALVFTFFGYARLLCCCSLPFVLLGGIYFLINRRSSTLNSQSATISGGSIQCSVCNRTESASHLRLCKQCGKSYCFHETSTSRDVVVAVLTGVLIATGIPLCLIATAFSIGFGFFVFLIIYATPAYYFIEWVKKIGSPQTRVCGSQGYCLKCYSSIKSQNSRYVRDDSDYDRDYRIEDNDDRNSDNDGRSSKSIIDDGWAFQWDWNKEKDEDDD